MVTVRAGESGQSDRVTTVSSQRLAVTSKTGANPMFRRIVICLPLTVFLLTISFADAQQTGKIFRIGFLDGSTASGTAGLLDAFRQELNKLGWIDGKNITIDYRF